MLTIKLSETHTQVSQEIPGNLQEELDSLRREVEGLRKALKGGQSPRRSSTNSKSQTCLSVQGGS